MKRIIDEDTLKEHTAGSRAHLAILATNLWWFNRGVLYVMKKGACISLKKHLWHMQILSQKGNKATVIIHRM